MAAAYSDLIAAAVEKAGSVSGRTARVVTGYAAFEYREEMYGIREHLRRKQSGRCGICGEKLGTGYSNLDHVFPQWRGGRNDGNLVLAHRPCNQAKGGRMPTGCELVWLALANAA